MNESAIKKAADAMRDVMPTTYVNGVQIVGCEIHQLPDLARAAYPHLSVWEEPTEEEKDRVYEAAHRNSAPVGMSRSQVEFALEAFWQIRNLNAPPVDPRVEALEPILRDPNLFAGGNISNALTRILAAIDEAKGKV